MEQPPCPAPGPLSVILVEPDIAANTGAIGRTCVAAGAILWLVRPLGFHLDDRHLRRAALDYWEHLDLRVVNSLAEAEDAIGAGRLWYFSTKAARPYTDASFAAGDALVFGPETRGLPERVLFEAADHAVRIPIRSEARSLNLANAVAIGVFEAIRQVQKSGTLT
jgi:tRNA (cytidine/uridine-2'-O-)-methyltransferase